MNRLSVSSKEKQKIQEEIQSLVYRYKSELVREQSAAVGEEARGNWLQRSWRPIVMLAFALVILSGCSWNRRYCPTVPVCGISGDRARGIRDRKKRGEGNREFVVKEMEIKRVSWKLLRICCSGRT